MKHVKNERNKTAHQVQIVGKLGLWEKSVACYVRNGIIHNIKVIYVPWATETRLRWHAVISRNVPTLPVIKVCFCWLLRATLVGFLGSIVSLHNFLFPIRSLFRDSNCFSDATREFVFSSRCAKIWEHFLFLSQSNVSTCQRAHKAKRTPKPKIKSRSPSLEITIYCQHSYSLILVLDPENEFFTSALSLWKQGSFR